MKIKTALLLVLTAASFVTADTWVNGYVRKDGTYVPGHWRKDPNRTPYDNYSTEGNYNPYTGKEGRKKCEEKYVSGHYDSEGNWIRGGYRTVCK